MTNKLWALTRGCLEGNPQRRPEIIDVIYHLRDTLATMRDGAFTTSDETVSPFCRWLSSSVIFGDMSTKSESEGCPRRFLHHRRRYGLDKNIKPEYASSPVFNVKARESWDGLQRVQSGFSDTCASTHRTTLGPRNLLGRAHSWLFNCAMSSGHECINSSDWPNKSGSSA